jgi:hypothetical protein
MKNLDTLQKEKAQIWQKMQTAMKEGNEEVFAQAFEEWTNFLQEAVLAEAKGMIQAADNTVLAGRGVRALTSEETKYYETLIQAMKSANPMQALADVTLVLPKTVIDSIFDDLKEEHPLLDAINFQNTGALIEILVNVQGGRQLATWGKLCDEIIKELTAGFAMLPLTQKKLSAFLPVCKAMLDLGPEWLDRYVRAHLSEAIANGLEYGIIDGTGVDKPIGMRRDPNMPFDPVLGYPELPPIPLNEITPETYGALIADLVTGPNGLFRVVTEVLLVVNPVDFFLKILPATSYQQPTGTWVNNIFPFPTKVVQSAEVPVGEAILGIAKRYFMALGTSKGGKIEYDDSYHFLEDERVYLTKLYGTGRPLDSRSFKRLDISNLKPVPWKVEVTNFPQEFDVGNFPAGFNVNNVPLPIQGVADARLTSLKVGNKVLSPVFNKSIFAYTCATTDATNTITAVAKDSEATIVIKNGETVVENGAAATWAEGENTLTVDVTVGGETERYTVIVTKS